MYHLLDKEGYVFSSSSVPFKNVPAHYTVEEGAPIDPPATKGLRYNFILNEWHETRTPEEITGDADATARRIRANLLSESDWTQLPDVDASIRDTWAPYRQLLRDITSQENYPETINWPTQP